MIVNEAVRLLLKGPDFESVGAVSVALHPRFRKWTPTSVVLARAVVHLLRANEPWKQPKQPLPRRFVPSMNAVAVRAAVILVRRSKSGVEADEFLERLMSNFNRPF